MQKNMTELVLRPRRPADDAFIYGLGEVVFASYSRSPTAALGTMLGEPGAMVTIAEQAGTPVGFTVVGLERTGRPFGPWARPALGRLNAISVLPELAGRGLGARLLDHAELIAAQEGAVSMTLMTAETNTRARRLFKSAGYSRLFTLEQAYAGGQRGLVMMKALR